MRKTCLSLLCFLVLLFLASLSQFPFYIPEAQAGTVTYTWIDSTSTVNITNVGTPTVVPWLTLRTQDRAAILKHQLHPIYTWSYRTWETSPLDSALDSEAEVRPLDDLALRLKVVVVNCTTAGVLTIAGTDARSAVLSEDVNIAANTTYQTTNYFRTVTLLSDDGTLTCKWQLWQDRWGIFGYNAGVPSITTDYVLQGGIIIGNGVTFAQTSGYLGRYKLTMRITADDAAIDLMPESFFHVDSGGTLIFGKLTDLATKMVSNGVAMTILTDLADNEIVNDGGTVCFYASSVSSSVCRISSNIGSTTRLWGSTLSSTNIMGYGYDISNHIITGTCSLVECTSMAFTATSIDRVTCLRPSYVIWDRAYRTADVTLTNVYSRGHTSVVWDISSGSDSDIYFIDPDFDTWTFSWAADRLGEVYRQYTLNLQTTFPNETTYSGANVTITYYGQGGGTVGSWLTNGNGNIPEQELSAGFYNVTGGNSIFDFNPYNLIVTSSDMQTINMNFTVMGTLDWRLPLQFNSAPVARFTYSPLNPQPSQMVSFNGSLSVDRDGSVSSYSWNFGDLQTGVGSTVQHAYATAGTYTVTLTVTDNQVSTDDFPQSVYVESVSVGGGQNVGLNMAPNFDINILKMPSYVITLPIWHRSFTMQTTVHNKGSFQQEVTLSYWLTVSGKSSKFWEGKQSFLLQSKETRPVDIEYPIPEEYGNYTAYAKVTYPAGSEGSLVQQSFTSYDVPNWLTSEGLLVLILIVAVPSCGGVAWATKEDKWNEWFDFD